MSDIEDEIPLINPIELFIFNESDNILDLYDDLESRFTYFFENNANIKLYDFLLNHIFKKQYNLNNLNNLNNLDLKNFLLFKTQFRNEINVLLQVVNNYLITKNIKKKITLNDWELFCYENF
jgi:hypothetical protein